MARKIVRQMTDGSYYYWLFSENSGKVKLKRYIRQELFSLKKQWM